MSKILLLLFFFLTSLFALAQRHNPKYDEWLRKEIIRDSLGLKKRPVKRDIYAGMGISASAGIVSLGISTHLGGSPSDYAKGSMFTYGTGPNMSLVIGNYYSPDLGPKATRFVYGFNLDYGYSSGSGSLGSYTHGAGGLLTNDTWTSRRISSNDTPIEFTSRQSRVNLGVGLGGKFIVTQDLTMGIMGGFCGEYWTTSADMKYYNNGFLKSGEWHLWGTYRGITTGVSLESYLTYGQYMFMTVKGTASANIIAWFFSPTVEAASTVSLSVGARLPFSSKGK